MLPAQAPPCGGRDGGASSSARRRSEPVATSAPSGRSASVEPDQRVARIAALGHGREHEPGHGDRRQVLGAVHREVGAPVEHGGLHLLGEHALAAELVDGHVEAPVALRVDDDELHLDRRVHRRAAATATCSACHRASGLPRVAARITHGGYEVAGVVVEGEEVAEGGDEAVAAGRAGGVLEGELRVVEQLADDPVGERLDGVELGWRRARRGGCGSARPRPGAPASARSRRATIIGDTSRADDAPR